MILPVLSEETDCLQRVAHLMDAPLLGIGFLQKLVGLDKGINLGTQTPRPRISRSRRTMTAMMSRRWINPPIV
jgi:hypothetical protein